MFAALVDSLPLNSEENGHPELTKKGYKMGRTKTWDGGAHGPTDRTFLFDFYL